MAQTSLQADRTVSKKARFIEALREGNYLCAAAKVAGIHRSTYNDWFAADPEFRSACKTASAEAETKMVAIVMSAATAGTWQAAAWFLERKHAQRWGKKQPDVVVQQHQAVGPALPLDSIEREQVFRAMADREAARRNANGKPRGGSS